MSTSAKLISQHADDWDAATRGPFLDGVRDGSLDPATFARWLEQDRHFVDALVRAWGLLLQSAPGRDLGVLAGGITAFTDELAWFDEITERRRLDLTGPAGPVAKAYRTGLLELAARSYPEAITAMWAVEAAYLEAWQHVHPGAPAFQDCVSHWANDEFAGFVAALAKIVDRELPDGPSTGATDAFLTVMRHEAAFWAMTTD